MIGMYHDSVHGFILLHLPRDGEEARRTVPSSRGSEWRNVSARPSIQRLIQRPLNFRTTARGRVSRRLGCRVGGLKAGNLPEVNQLEFGHLPHGFDEGLGSLYVRTNQGQLTEPR